MLVWICILASIFIYLGIGIYVFRARGRLRQLSGTGSNVRVMASYPTTNQTDQDKVRPTRSKPHFLLGSVFVFVCCGERKRSRRVHRASLFGIPGAPRILPDRYMWLTDINRVVPQYQCTFDIWTPKCRYSRQPSQGRECSGRTQQRRG